MQNAKKRARDTGFGPTPQRMAKGDIKLKKGGGAYVHRLSVLEQLRAKSALDGAASEVLFAAGLAFADVMWSDPATMSVRAIDLSKPKVDASGFNSYLDVILDSKNLRDRYRRTFQYLEREAMIVLTLVIIHDMTIEDVAAELFGRNSKGEVRKLDAQETRSRLCGGLRQVATWLKIPGYL
jgi:hypothetical protein